MRFDARYWIERLQLKEHVEGGAYARTYTSAVTIPTHTLSPAFGGDRPSCTAIFFLLEANQFSAMHRIAADELWHFYYGDPLLVYEITASGELITHRMGNDPNKEEQFQSVVKAGSWFGSKLAPGGEYALVGCTVSPGFDFADFQLGARAALLLQYPQHSALIQTLTH